MTDAGIIAQYASMMESLLAHRSNLQTESGWSGNALSNVRLSERFMRAPRSYVGS